MSTLSGQQLGHYKVLEPLGAGGMGVVYRAQDTVLGRMVALKVLPQTASNDPEAVNRFRREARTASSLNHPNICTIYGFDDQDGRCYLAMELLEGETLDRRLVQGPLDQKTLVDIATQVADALDAAHVENVLHRDIKPANIFLTKRGQAKVLDFGLAKLADHAHRRGVLADQTTAVQPMFTSVVGTTVGTVAYMSPEQARAEALDSRTDLFSLGVVIYEMATGRVSFPGNTTAVVFDGILNRDPAPASSLNPGVSADLDRIIAKALEKDRGLRYQTAADLRADLQRLRRDSSSRRVVASSTSSHTPAPTAPTPAPSAAQASDPTVVLPPVRHSMVSIDPSAAMTVALPPASSAGSVPAPSAAPVLPQAPPMPPSAPAAPAARGNLMLWAGATAVAAAAALAFAVLGGGSSDAPQPTSEPVATTASPTPEPPPTATPNPTSGTPTAPPTPPIAAAPEPPKGAATPAPTTAKPAASGTTPGTAPSTGAVRPATKNAAAEAVKEAATRLEVARAKLNSNLADQGLADLRSIVSDFPATPVAADASFLAAETLTRLGRIDDAMAAHVEFANRFTGDARIAASQVALAELTLKSRQPNREDQARALFGRAAAAAPGSPAALRALQAKAAIEERRRVKTRDMVAGKELPAQLETYRTLADQFQSSPQGMLALYRLATGLADEDQWELAAAAWTDLGTRFPDNPHDAWWALGELYERRLRDGSKAKAAYAQVPATSKRYQDAQRKLTQR